MPPRPGVAVSQRLPIGPTGTRMLQADEAFRLVRNFRPTAEGGFVSINGPIPYLELSGGGVPTNGDPDPNDPVYGDVYGVHIAHLRNGDREVILLHTDDQIWEFEGWDREFRPLVGPAYLSPFLETEIPVPDSTDFPTQWATTPIGVVIVPQGGRAMFYDGDCILPLGYDAAPSAPTGLGPESSANRWFPDTAIPRLGINDAGYALDGLVYNWDSASFNAHGYSAMFPWHRYGRLGTVDTPGNVTALAESGSEDLKSQVMGYLLPGEYRSKVQFIDRWGNLSPLSASSNPVIFKRQPAQVPTGSSPYQLRWCEADGVKKQVAWVVPTGPEGTIGRIVYRTKDLRNSGTTAYWELPRDSMVTPDALATMPDNMSNMYPDNIPDSWLANQPEEIQPVPLFRLCAVAFSRLFMANADGDEGALWYSMVGRYGTIEKKAKLYPAPDGSAITGLHAVPGGLMVFSRSGVYLVEENDSGDAFRSKVISQNHGCVAPSSIVTTRQGAVIWLGHDGFYAWHRGEVAYMWDDYRDWRDRLDKGRLQKSCAYFDSRHGEYRCWVPYNGTSSKMCFVFDGVGWRQRNDIDAAGVCTTPDNRSIPVVAGRGPSGNVDLAGNPQLVHGLWVLDHAGDQYDGLLQTGWIRATRSEGRASVRRIYLWLRETSKPTSDAAKITVKGRVDYRAEVVDETVVTPNPDTAPAYGPVPYFFGDAEWGDATWRKRRPYWAVADLSLNEVETFQVEISSTGRFEILAISFEEAPRDHGGATQTR